MLCSMIYPVKLTKPVWNQGIYDYVAMRRQWNRHERKNFFHANFASPSVEFGVNIKTKTGPTYRGCRAKHDLDAHTLVSASKAFVFAEEDKKVATVELDVYSKQMGLNSDVQIVSKCIALVLIRPQAGRLLYKLSAGEGFSENVPDQDQLKLDIPRIRAIMKNNRFSGGLDDSLCFTFEVHRSDMEKKMHRQINQEEGKLLSDKLGISKGCGIWINESLFNHSCIPNCAWSQIGDHMFLYTTRPVPKGEELCISYVDSEKPFQTKENETFAHWIGTGQGFKCCCEWCYCMRSNEKLRIMNGSQSVSVTRYSHETGGSKCDANG